jgi:aminoglycoside phosphotransferase (APT) family kinase protein
VADPDPALVRWVLDTVGSDGPVDEIRGLRAGGSPWLFRVGGRAVVLRIGSPESDLRVENAALGLAHRNAMPVPRPVAVDVDHDPPLLLIEMVSGNSTIPRERAAERLTTLGACAARLHRILVPADLELPSRDRPIGGTDFAALRRAHPPQPLLVRGEQVLATYQPQAERGFVHGDFWQGNTLWEGDTLSAIVDWDCAGVGPAGVDLGSLRCDAALCFGRDAADDVLRGWEQEAGRPADDVAYWDVVAALSTPPDMGWFVSALGGQGRTDLTQDVMLTRRDLFLGAALDRIVS